MNSAPAGMPKYAVAGSVRGKAWGFGLLAGGEPRDREKDIETRYRAARRRGRQLTRSSRLYVDPSRDWLELLQRRFRNGAQPQPQGIRAHQFRHAARISEVTDAYL